MPDITHPYEPLGVPAVGEAWRRTHANNEQTFVWCERVATDGVTVVMAADVYQPDLRPIAAECVALAPDGDSAMEHARRWMAANPKGIAAGDDEGDGWLSKVWGWLCDLDANPGDPTVGQGGTNTDKPKD